MEHPNCHAVGGIGGNNRTEIEKNRNNSTRKIASSILAAAVNIKYMIPPLWWYSIIIKFKIQSIRLYFEFNRLYTICYPLFTIEAEVILWISDTMTHGLK
jgi:hypothetical protein